MDLKPRAFDKAVIRCCRRVKEAFYRCAGYLKQSRIVVTSFLLNSDKIVGQSLLKQWIKLGSRRRYTVEKAKALHNELDVVGGYAV